MSIGSKTTGKTIFLTALTLAITEPIEAYYYDATEIFPNVKIVNSKSINYSYVEDKYKVENSNYENEIIAQAQFVELVSLFANEQKDLDPEFQGYLNEFEIFAGKKVPSKPRL
ncbi:MAG: hypothetical protein FIA92_09380 [Chloroflexi bacterium]|nr:hypothetical protein [Chloroflexota bacterium]